MTILQAILKVMQTEKRPMSPKEIYDLIVGQRLYTFHADNPISVVRIQIQRSCFDSVYSKSSKVKYFIKIDNKYSLVPIDSHQNVSSQLPSSIMAVNSSADSVKIAYDNYISDLKTRVLDDIKSISPEVFEQFSRKLLVAYGFIETHTTKLSNDGGVDGYGKLKVGMASLNVAFQCKRWSKNNIQRTDIDKFRGAIQGEYEQGVFFTTSSFSKGAIDASIKKGAVPIVLIDGRAIVDLMLDKKFGFQTETILLPTYSLDLVLDD